jgi:selenide, water dikinase
MGCMAMETVVEKAEESAGAVRLTQQVKAGGCASKLAPGTLSAVLGRLPKQENPNLLVGFETADDAGVYRLSEREALVQTVDFFTPMVDDPFTYGRIAATNALSDVYAMGGRAITALALVCFPQDGDLNVLEQIMRGGLSVMDEAGCVVVGGHSVRDNEIKFGYAVTGLVDPARVKKNTGAEVGDALVFTKALGTGVITTALKQGKAQAAWVDAAVESMTTSNRRAAEIAVSPKFEVHAMTDVTGFGLMGHGRELAFGSGVGLEIRAEAVQVLSGALEAIDEGCVPAGLLSNREYAGCVVQEAQGSSVRDGLRSVVYDPQTAGGLLISVAAADADALVGSLRQAGYGAAGVIGRVVQGPPRIVLA